MLVNGNTTPTITKNIEQTARKIALPGTEVRAVTPVIGPATVEGYLDGQLSALGVCEAIAAHQDEADAFVIACFSDPGLYAARELSEKPVVGIAETAMATAIQLGHRFGLLTPQRRLRPVLEGMVRLYGFTERLAGVRVVDREVADVASSSKDRLEKFLDAAQHSLADDGAEVLILAGAVLSGLDVELSELLAAPVLDPVRCAVVQAQSLVLSGVQTSGVGSFAYSLRKPCLNCPPGIASRVYEPLGKPGLS